MNYTEIILDHKRSKEERVQAAFQLANKIDKKTLESLIEAMLTDNCPIVRHEALSALGSLGDPSYIPIIEKYLNHHDEIVRDSAEMARERILRYRGGKCFIKK